MRGLIILSVVLAVDVLAGGASAQTPTLTNCMMSCNAQSASCQSGCLIPSAPSTSSSSTSGTTNPTANTACILNCSASQLNCHTACARQPPTTAR